MANRDVRIRIGGDSSEAVGALETAEGKLKGFAGQVNATRGTLSAFSGALSFVGAGLMARELLQTAVSVDKFNNSMTYAVGSAQQGAIELGFVRAEALRLGLDLETAQTGFVKLAASAHGTILEGKATRDIFTAISEASTVLGMSADETNGSILAISQMISKGTVQAEELRGQLGERLPGAFQIAARSLGVTTSELDGMLKKGEVVAADFLPKFAAEMHKAFGGQAAKVDTAQKAINRFNTAVFDLKQTVVEGGASDALKTLVGWGTGLVSIFKESVRWIREATVYWGALFDKAKAWSDAGGLIGLMKADNKETLKQQWKNIDAAALAAMQDIAKDFDKKAVGDPGAPGTGGGPGKKKDKKGLTEEQKIALSDAKDQIKDFFRDVNAEIDKEIAGESFGKFKATDVIAKRFGGLKYDSKKDSIGFTPFKYEKNFGVNSDEMAANARGEMTPEQQAQFDRAAGQSAVSVMNEQAGLKEREFEAEKASIWDEGHQQRLLQLQTEQDAWINSWAMQTDSYEVYEQRKAVIDEHFTQRREQLSKNEAQNKLKWASSGFSSMGSMMESFYTLSNKKARWAFEAAKVMKIGETVTNTASAAMGAYYAMASIPYVGPVLGAAAAAAAVAAGAAQIATIQQQTPDGGTMPSSVAPGGGVYGAGTSTSPIVTQPLTSIPKDAGTSLTIIVQGNVVDNDKFARELVPSINKALKDGVT